MKACLKYCLILFTFICYFSASLELCETEEQQNYEKETHIYLHAEKNNQPFFVKTEKQTDEFYLLKDFFHHCFIASDNIIYSLSSFYKNIPPPKLNKLYLYNAVFLV